MKYVLIFIASINIAFAQTERITHPELNRFVGKWTGSVGNEIFTIILKKDHINIKETLGMDISYDRLIGYHEYKVGNAIKESNLSDSNYSFSANKYSILGGYSGGYQSPVEDYNIIEGTLSEKQSNRSQVFTIKKQGNKLLLTLEGPVPGVRLNGPTKPLVLPQHKTFTLTKVN